jgi:hypothetical protein
MSEIYISQYEKAGLKAIDEQVLRQHIDDAIWNRSPSDLYDLPLSKCGQHVSRHLNMFVQALAEYTKAKSSQKRAETESRAQDAGRKLIYAVQDMQSRLEEEEKELQLVQIDEPISSPAHFSEQIDVRISYRWRRTVDVQWTRGSIVFTHKVDMRPNRYIPVPKKPLSAAKQEDARQEQLYEHWKRFKWMAINSVREYLRSGGDGNAIPDTFQAKLDTHTRSLNNFSCNFWLD